MNGIDPGLVPRWFEHAHAEIGVRETPGTKATPRILAYWDAMPGWNRESTDEMPWCSAFVQWALKQCGIKGTDHPAAKSWLTWGGARSHRPGAIVVIRHRAGKTPITGSGFHVGFYAGGNGAAIRLLGGNQGDSVSEAVFSLAKWDVLASRWPLEEKP